MSKEQNRNYIYVVIILLIVALLFSALFRAHENYLRYKENKDYLSQPNKKIQGWMNIKIISANFNLSSQEIFKEMGVDETKINPHISLDRFCKEYNQNCTLLIERLNNRAGR